MTRRAARMLAALEDGCTTRPQIFAHQGRFALLNNAAAELRAAGIHVGCTLADGEYHYTLLDGHGVANGAVLSPSPRGHGSVVFVGQHDTGGNGTNADRLSAETSSGSVGASTGSVACSSVPAGANLQLELVAA